MGLAHGLVVFVVQTAIEVAYYAYILYSGHPKSSEARKTNLVHELDPSNATHLYHMGGVGATMFF